MSFVPERDRKLILDLMLGRTPEDGFLREYGARREEMPAKSLEMLRRALAEKDPQGVEFGKLLMFKFGFSKEFLDILNQLAEAPWHTRHEDVVSALADLKDPSSVEILARTAVASHPYLEFDKAFALGTKSIYALWGIQTPEAVAKLGELARNKNRVLKSTAKDRLKDIAKKGTSESAKAAAKQMLEIAKP